MLDDPRPLYARARAEEPIYWSEKLNLWVVTRYDDVRAIARDADRFSSRNSISPVSFRPAPEVLEVLAGGFLQTACLVDSDPPLHTRVRALASEALSLRRIKGFEPALRELANKLVDQFIDAGHVEFVGQFAVPLPGSFIVDLLGLPREDLARVNNWTIETGAFFAGAGSLEELVGHTREFVAFQRYLTEAADLRRSDPRDDALSVIVQGADEDPALSPAELVNMLNQIVFAGYETTAGMLAAAGVELGRDPELFAALKADTSIAPKLIEEVLRSASPIHSMYRTAKEDVEIGGVTIRAGQLVQIAYISANHDGDRFSDPLRFELGRPTPHLAFGQGPHFCVGAPLARLEGRVALEVIAERFETLRLVPGQTLSYVPSLTARRLAAVELSW
ncbi:Cytochrome P450 107B1 [Enhygromyxa salina]|uniref:Cytochrome P450 107B1 n=2 Tax=Enhygromyxa salina TaxID=215803 RepID=A0A2S9YL81_9BACT|nr:Cytochrome P450 107B1 [Enhygromyxa salina]